MLKYLSSLQIISIHDRIIEEFSKEKGQMNIGNLEATLERVMDYKGNDSEALFWKATIMLERIILGHPFIDGNKRTGYEATKIFLLANGYRLIIKEEEVIAMLIAIAQNKKNRFSIKAWLTKHANLRAQPP
ncbi:type II toxin-antitoxin system death-on-curing family toxin [Candidatus Micrarchaeota archaeon]|nr:type II toxin-antitoxin system death-on-curing family toxin [Candidatus Micrarchaeota archaeon]